MKRVFLYASLIFLAGCVYSAPEPVYYESTYLEPLPSSLMVEPPRKVTEAPPELEKRTDRLPPVIVIPGRSLYFYNELYYYHVDGEWYFAKERGGPWYRLKSQYYPEETTKETPPKPYERVRPRRPSETYP